MRKGTRLNPLPIQFKQLIPIGNKPLIAYTIELLLQSGIEEIGILVNDYNKAAFQQVLDTF